jgi:hypothetical protein
MKTKTHEISDLMRISQKNVEKFSRSANKDGDLATKNGVRPANKERNQQTNRQTDGLKNLKK